MNLNNPYNLRTSIWFKNLYGEPFVMTDGQVEIFKAIYEPSILRAAVTAITQYGKSEVASMALICSAIERKEKILIIAPSTEQAGIIMEKIIGHIFDHDEITATIEYRGRLERLKSETSKTRLTFRNGSEIRILTADARTISKEAKGLMGFGATMVVVDESALIPDQLFSKILRMVGGVRNGKLVQLSNPFEENHFDRALHNPKYHRVQIDWRQALKEGRVTQEFLDEAKAEMPEMDWIIFYESKTPKSGVHNQVIPTEWIELAMGFVPPSGEGEKHAGLDVARFGGDKTVFSLIKDRRLLPQWVTEKLDTMEVAGWCSEFIDEQEPDNTNVDVVGLGAGVYDRLNELEYDVTAIDFGGSPVGEEKDRYANIRAQAIWGLRELLKPVDGKPTFGLPNDPELKKELAAPRYGYNSERKIKIESKDDIKKRIGKSPDKSDSFALAAFTLTEGEPEMIIG